MSAPNNSQGPPDREQRLNELIAAYLTAEDAGVSSDRAALLRLHPDLAEALAEFFREHDEIRRLAAPLLLADPLEEASGECEPTLAGPTVAGPLPTGRADGGSVEGDVLPRHTMVRYFGDYELRRVLGRGGMGIVYKARQISLNRSVALKMLRAELLATEDDLRRFQNEAEAVALLDHPHIVPIYEVGEYRNQRYFTMKLIGGSSLDRRLESFAASDPRAAARLVATVAGAVHHAHQRGILHRDLKPANILLDEQGQPYVSDFGLAKRVGGTSELTFSGAIVGTPSYMAPEQASGQRGTVTTATDVYGLGAVLYALLTGRAPFAAGSVVEALQQVREQPPAAPSKHNPRVSRDLETICLKCLEKEPARRYATAEELASDLNRYLAGETIRARATPVWERGWKWARRRPAAAALAGLCLTSVIGLSVAAERSHASAREAARRSDERVERLRREALDSLERAQQQRVRSELDEARLTLSTLLMTLRSEPRLAGFRSDAERTLAQTRRDLADRTARRVAEERYRRFLRGRDDALSRGAVLSMIGLPPGVGGTEAACREALALYGVSEDDRRAPALADPRLDPREQAEVAAGCHEVLLLLAETLARPVTARATGPDESLRRALRVLDRSAALFPRRQADERLRAVILEQLGDGSGKAEALRAAESITPATAADFFLSGQERLRHESPERALLDFDRALRLRPDDFQAQYFSAVCYLKLKRPAEARACLSAYLSRRADFVWVYLLRGVAYGQLDNLEAAEDDFREALRLASDVSARYGVYVNRGLTRVRLGKAAEAAADLRQAVALLPDQYQGHALLAWSHQVRQEFPEALAELNEAIRLEPALPLLFRNRAELKRERHDLAGAIADFEQAARLEPPDSPNRADDHAARAALLVRSRAFGAAIEACDAAIEARPDHPSAHLLRARALLGLGRFEDAARSCDRDLERTSPTLDAFQTRGIVRARLGDYPGAVDDYSRAITRDSSREIFILRGWAYGYAGAWLLALRDFEEASRRSPQTADTRISAGYARARLGRDRDALDDAEAAIRLGPSSADEWFNLACTFSLVAGRRGDDPEGLAVLCDRALDSLGKALDSLPVNRRPAYWRDKVHPDQDLGAIRATRGYKRLEETFDEGRPATAPASSPR